MCQRVLISKNIASISTRSFARKFDVVSGIEISQYKLSRLNNSLDNLYDLIYTQINDIDSDDYKILGPQLDLLLFTVKDLYKTLKRKYIPADVKKEVNLLWNHYSDLFEINYDLKNFHFNPKLPKDLSEALTTASKLITTL